jgi:leucyl/phenylalanyl-tRNA--protein transferase
LRPGDLQVSKRLGQYARRSSLEVRFNRSFDAVMQACAGERRSQQGTWITAEMLAAYQELHRDGWAHSIEVWNNDDLVGGLYGLCIGRVFFGESMFSAVDNASKFAMLGLTGHMLLCGLEVIDCQVVSPHLLTMGASTVSRRQFTKLLGSLCVPACRFTDWPVDSLPVAETLQIWRSVALH